ncbi:MAG: hypothetical protein BWX49_01195 [Bacteroidetes bacterium ADurb.Bin008]|nr:MAG: hypothetical protein BWX49_01195 [Bacteroidetes bacterium ADurb.Bin008]
MAVQIFIHSFAWLPFFCNKIIAAAMPLGELLVAFMLKINNIVPTGLKFFLIQAPARQIPTL